MMKPALQCILLGLWLIGGHAAASNHSPASVAAEWVHSDLATASVDAAIELAPRARGAEFTAWERSFTKMQTRYVRFQVDRIDVPAGADMELQFISDSAGVIVERYTARQLGAARSLVTGLLPAGQLRVRVVLRELGHPASMRLAGIQWQAPSTSTVPQAAMQRGDPVATLAEQHELRRLGESVAMLHIGPLGSTCTAFVIDRDVLATNHHCMKYSLRFQQGEGLPVRACGDILAEFDYVREREVGKTAPCTEVVKADAGRDLVLLRFALPLTSRGTVRPALTPSTGDPAAGRLQILHHPMGRPLIYEDGCKFRGRDEPDYLHDCGTTPGSSGSVLLSQDGKLVGVHYRGPFDLHLTQEQVYELYRIHGPLYNRAKPAALLSNFP